MNAEGTRRRRAVPLTGWVQWVLVVAVALCPLFVDTWLNVQTRLNDYELFEIRRCKTRLERELADLEVEMIRLEATRRIQPRADDVGLVEPVPGQAQTVLYVADRTGAPRALARAGAAADR